LTSQQTAFLAEKMGRWIFTCGPLYTWVSGLTPAAGSCYVPKKFGIAKLCDVRKLATDLPNGIARPLN
jgi:hypothetical protein